jgi:RimJ/RimL family protein N-acetyltransferase
MKLRPFGQFPALFRGNVPKRTTVCPTIGTERLIMRPFREDDVDAYTAMLQTPEVRASLHLPDDIGREQAFSQMCGWLGQWELRGTGQWALQERTTGVFVGRAGSHWPERVDWPGIEIGWTLHPEHWGKGYATEAGAAAVQYVFAHHVVDEIYSMILPENAASRAVAKRLGFTQWELRRFVHFPELEHMIWRLKRAEYEAQLRAT